MQSQTPDAAGSQGVPLSNGGAANGSIQSLALCYSAVGCRHALAVVTRYPCTTLSFLKCFHVTIITGTTYLHANILEIHCLSSDAAAVMAAAASSAGVYWIEPKTAVSTRNWSGKSIIGTGRGQAFAAGQPNPSKVFSTVSLQNSTIGVADSGLSINNCYFCSLNAGIADLCAFASKLAWL
jgi:hypothetical protein